ncbi:MAG: assimilatory sulfite reductase (NADPH) flavoprotein subunit [Neisseria sp.]|nr:assimilatory sulfite reductase (NADPH) flavoprotein subunit [Neisseria sp.]
MSNPISPELLQQLNTLSSQQLAFLAGFAWAKSQQNSIATSDLAAVPSAVATVAHNTPAKTVCIISASQTGNARKVGEQLHDKLHSLGIAVKHFAAGDFKPKNIADEQTLLLITSTQGEGEPPEEGISLHKFLFGKKAPQLNGLQFAVLGLGDSSYPKFCGAAREFDAQLAKLGGERLQDLGECDLAFQAAADAWIEQIVPKVQSLAQSTTPQTADGTNPTSLPSAVSENVYTKENPYPAPLIVQQKITGRYSEKDVRHIELDLSGSGLTYTAGDALGVWFSNDADLVDEILAAVSLTGDEEVNGKTLREALIHDYELTQNTPQFVRAYAQIVAEDALNAAIAADLNAFVQNNPIVGIVQQYPTALNAEQLIAMLRPLTPRLYSIASAQDEVGEEVHLTVGALRYEHAGKTREGGASSYLAKRVAEDETVRVFVEHNPHFRLPSNGDTPIVMIGSGTGVAPFRAFVQQRAASEANGKNWLIFGNQRASEDFLYQTEWQQFAKDGYLHRYSFAWSRDQQQKIYVQDKIRENAAELWQWLQNGAHVYVCGDASKMAKDVEQALIEVIAQEGGFSREDAEEYLDELRQDKRYQRDVY